MLAGAPNDIVRANGSRDPADGVVRVFLLAGQSNMEGHAQTRTFPMEAELETGDEIVAAGVTASLIIPAGEVQATLIKPSLLTLSDSGQLGVRHVLEDDTVAFAQVNVIDETPQGAWVTGLPERILLISMGQDYLNDGVKIQPVPAGGAR